MISGYIIRLEGKDFHGSNCGCGFCNSNGHSYEAAIYELILKSEKELVELLDDNEQLCEILENKDKLTSLYGPSEEAALKEARAVCQQTYGKLIAEF